MAEPATSSFGAWAMVLAMLATIGLGVDALFWALIGTTVGQTASPQLNIFRAIAVYIATVLGAALLGTYVAASYMDAGKYAGNVASFTMGVLFQPILAAATSAVPQVISGWLARFGAKTP
jgi:hypothetical protein